MPASPAPRRPASTRPSAPPLSHGRALAALAVLSITAFTFVTSETLPFGLITLISQDLGRSEAQIGLIVTVHALVIMVFSFPLAHVTRHIPRRRLLPAVLAVFVVGTLVVATAGSYAVLVAGRILTACAHATFWSVAPATAAGLFPPAVQGRTVARLLLGASAAGVVGLPAATWLGQRAGWHAPFLVLAGLGAATAVVIAMLLPHYRPSDGTAARGSAPSRRRFVLLLGVVLLTIVGVNVTFTYITPFLRDVTGFSARTIPALLVASGIAGLLGMVAVARFLDRYARRTMVVGLAFVTFGWVAMAAFGSEKTLAVAALCLAGFGSSVLVGSFSNRILQVSPGSTDAGIAIYGSTYNAGIALGSLVGAGVFDASGARVLPVVTTAFVVGALALLAAKPRLALPRAR